MAGSALQDDSRSEASISVSVDTKTRDDIARKLNHKGKQQRSVNKPKSRSGVGSHSPRSEANSETCWQGLGSEASDKLERRSCDSQSSHNELHKAEPGSPLLQQGRKELQGKSRAASEGRGSREAVRGRQAAASKRGMSHSQSRLLSAAASPSMSPVGRQRRTSHVQEVKDNLRRALEEDSTPAFQGRAALVRWHVKRVEHMKSLVKEAALELPPESPTLSAGRKCLQRIRGLPLELFVLPPTPREADVHSLNSRVEQHDDSGSCIDELKVDSQSLPEDRRSAASETSGPGQVAVEQAEKSLSRRSSRSQA